MNEERKTKNEEAHPATDGEASRFQFFRSAFFVPASLVAAGAALGPLSDDASRATRPEGFVVTEAVSAETAGEGLLVATMGGLRTLAADAFWLRAYVMWERRDRAACTVFSRAACALAPEAAYFREGYANWVAFDFPHWTVRDLGGRERVPESEQRALHLRDARAALAYVEEQMRRDPAEARYPLLAGQIAAIKLKDRALSADYFRRSAETPAGPWYPAMLYTSFLVETGRGGEAAIWLKKYAEGRPFGSQSREIALERLAGLPKEISH